MSWKKQRINTIILWIAVACAGLSVSSALAQGGFSSPLFMASVQEIQDEFGDTLQGHALAPGDLVITYRALGGVIEPPDTNGVAHVNNTMIPGGVSGVGSLTPTSLTEPGVFGLAIGGGDRPGHGQQIFVRVFNDSTVTGASFYADSQLVTVDENQRFALAINATDQPIDPGDDDSDGLNNSYEKSLGTDKADPDTDGDGTIDGAEFVAGTDGTDDQSEFIISQILGDGNDIILQWASVEGKTYQPLASPVLLGVDVFTNMGSSLVATSGVTQVQIPDELLQTFHNYSVQVLGESGL